MLYCVGTAQETTTIQSLFPGKVVEEVLTGAVVRDAEYGCNRDYKKIGGYSLLAETKKDIQRFKDIINYETHPCEWATRIGSTGYVSALYILNDDFTIDIFMPLAIAPEAILKDLED